MKVVWSCASIITGAQCVLIGGGLRRVKLSAGHLDIQRMVCFNASQC